MFTIYGLCLLLDDADNAFLNDIVAPRLRMDAFPGRRRAGWMGLVGHTGVAPELGSEGRRLIPLWHQRSTWRSLRSRSGSMVQIRHVWMNMKAVRLRRTTLASACTAMHLPRY